jgi:general secretion pathway protein J
MKAIKGFTLIEVLVSLTLLTVILGAVYSSFFSIQRAMERFDKVSLKYHETRTALDMIRREIESSLIKNPREKDISKEKASFIIKDRDIFGKSTSSIEFTAFSFRGNNPNTISYFVESKDGKLHLLKTEKPLLRSFKKYTVEIVEDIEGFTVETLFNKKWVRTWDTANTGILPELVRISIEFEDNGKIVKLTEYARPRIGRQL